ALDDPLTANLDNIVSDDYSDILSGTPEDNDDTRFEDKWALELIGNDEPAGMSKDSGLGDPDLSSIEAYQDGQEFSFTEIHEQNRRASDTHSSSPGTYVDEYHNSIQDDYQDDFRNTYADDSAAQVADEYVDEYHTDDSDPYNEPGSPKADLNYNELSGAQSAMSLGGNLDLTNEVALNIPAAVLDPIDFDQQKKDRSFGFLWGLAALFLVMLIAGQVAWFKMDTLSRNDNFRPYYVFFCDALGCELPGIQNVALIRATNTVFNPHRSMADALVIDTLLTNGASYPQPYPDLELEFRDLNNRIVAQRTFAPSEYLAGGVLPGDLMPPGTPVHIAIEVINPGPDAVTRQIFVRGNQ
ncbi:MAG: DUF3426 domain-containing protein, partial [Thalassolituus sp.]